MDVTLPHYYTHNFSLDLNTTTMLFLMQLKNTAFIFIYLTEQSKSWPYQQSSQYDRDWWKTPTFLRSHFAKAPLFFHKGADNQQPQPAADKGKYTHHQESMSWSFTTAHFLT